MPDTRSLTYLCPDVSSEELDRHPVLMSWRDRLSAVLARVSGGGAAGGRSAAGGDGDLPDDHQLRHAQKLAVAGRLATGLVHDFNNLLLVANACLDLIAETPDDPAFVQEQVRTATDALRRASELTRRLATFGRPDDGSRRQVDLSEVVRATARLVEPAVGVGIRVVVSCPSAPLPVHVDPPQIEQAILNLCLNARDAMPQGGRLLLSTRSAVRRVPRGGVESERVATTYAIVEVSDTGSGIPLDLQAVVFEPFFTTKSPGQGSGLGLPMVRQAALTHEGLVELTSDAEGTAFRLLLPMSC